MLQKQQSVAKIASLDFGVKGNLQVAATREYNKT
jgi:hypothetical protein